MAGAERVTIEEVVKQVMVRGRGDVVRAALEAGGRGVRAGRGRAGERTPDSATHRNGYRGREWQTRAGSVELQIAKLRRRS
jgi:putative transposase